jgi:scyllo-inositol 2-dehydrogenase (NADP+)
MTAMTEIGAGIVGYGLAGKWFHKMLIDATPGLRVAAVMARNPQRAAEARADNPDAAIVDDLTALVDHPEVDLVVLATPHDVHCEQAVFALERGKHVVSDKIMCRSVAEADAMIAASDRHGRLLSVFHNRRWDSDFLTVREALGRRLLGEVWSIDIAIARPAMPLAPLGPDKRWRATRSGFGGQLVDWGAHLMDQAVLLAGCQPEQVFCDLQYRQPGNECESEAWAILKYRSGLRVSVMVSYQGWQERPHWFINGSEGSLRICGIDPQEGIMRTGHIPSGTPEAAIGAEQVHYVGQHDPGDFGPLPGRWLDYYANVRDTLGGEAELAVTPQQCRDVLRVYERCFRAAGLVNETTAGAAGLLG